MKADQQLTSKSRFKEKKSPRNASPENKGWLINYARGRAVAIAMCY